MTLEAENSCGIVTDLVEVIIDLTSVEDLTENDFIISPNPNHGDFQIVLPDLEGNEIVIELLSLEGKLIETKRYNFTSPGQKITWNDVSKGIYFLKFDIGTKELTRKIIVH